MPDRRSKLKLYLDILESIKMGEHRPTHIQFGTHVTWQQFNDAVTYLVETGLVEKRYRGSKTARGALRYYLTPKGEEEMKKISYVINLMEEPDQEDQ